MKTQVARSSRIRIQSFVQLVGQAAKTGGNSKVFRKCNGAADDNFPRNTLLCSPFRAKSGKPIFDEGDLAL